MHRYEISCTMWTIEQHWYLKARHLYQLRVLTLEARPKARLGTCSALRRHDPKSERLSLKGESAKKAAGVMEQVLIISLLQEDG